MRIADNGFIGIGATNPQVPLDIVGSANINNQNYNYFNISSDNIQGPGTYSENFSIRASARILAQEFDASSDLRIKEPQDISKSGADLVILNSLDVTDFKYKDKVEYGDKVKKGFIAQQVETAYPEAITKTTNLQLNLILVEIAKI